MIDCCDRYQGRSNFLWGLEHKVVKNIWGIVSAHNYRQINFLTRGLSIIPMRNLGITPSQVAFTACELILVASDCRKNPTLPK